MNVKERVLASRLIEKIDIQISYSQKIGLSCDLGKRSQKSQISKLVDQGKQEAAIEAEK